MNINKKILLFVYTIFCFSLLIAHPKIDVNEQVIKKNKDTIPDTLILKLDFFFGENNWIIQASDTSDNEFLNFTACLKSAKKLNYKLNKIKIVCFTSPAENIYEKDTSLILVKNRLNITREIVEKYLSVAGFNNQCIKTHTLCKTVDFIQEMFLIKDLVTNSNISEKELIYRVLFMLPDPCITNREVIRISENKPEFKEKLKLLCKTTVEIELL